MRANQLRIGAPRATLLGVGSYFSRILCSRRFLSSVGKTVALRIEIREAQREAYSRRFCFSFVTREKSIFYNRLIINILCVK